MCKKVEQYRIDKYLDCLFKTLEIINLVDSNKKDVCNKLDEQINNSSIKV